MARLRLGKPPAKRLVPHNLESWHVVVAIMSAYGGAAQTDLEAAVRQHRHEYGGTGFIQYCLRQGWLVRDEA